MYSTVVCGDVSSSGKSLPVQPHLSELLDAEGLLALLAYEESHGNREAIVQALAERLAAVRNGTEPTGPLGVNLPPTAAG